MSSVLVIGGGLAGLTAALEAAESGAAVTLLQAGQGVHHLFSGCVDLLAYPDPEGEAASSPLEAIAQLRERRPSHPYAKAGVEAVREAVDRFLARTAAQGLIYVGDGARQRRVLTAVGNFRPTGLTPESMAIEPEQIGVVCGLERCRNFAEALVAAELSQRTGRPVRSLSFISEGTRHDVMGIAALFKDEEYRQRLGDFLAQEAKGEVVAAPALLGVEQATQIRTEIESRFAGRLIEVPGLPPSVPGMRLFAALRRAARDAGVRLVAGAKAVSPVVAGKQLKGMQVRSGPATRTETADAIVLATGHLVSGGLVSARDSLREPLFDLPLAGIKNEPFFHTRFLDRRGHPALRAGVMVDESWRPMREGQPVFKNLFACGDLLAGFDPYSERSGGGAAITTGMLAGRAAAEAG